MAKQSIAIYQSVGVACFVDGATFWLYQNLYAPLIFHKHYFDQDASKESTIIN